MLINAKYDHLSGVDRFVKSRAILNINFYLNQIHWWETFRGSEVQGSAQPPAKKIAGQIEKETLKKRILHRRTSIESRMINVECRMSKECTPSLLFV